MSKSKINIFFVFLISLNNIVCAQASDTSLIKTNIILIYLDDLGYGDLGSYNLNSKIPTPNLDQLASEGVRFTNAHTPAAICGPSRYGILTGSYPWRKEGGMGNGHAYDTIKIEKGKITIANLLKTNGYNTAILGKWGLRYDFKSALKEGVDYKVNELSFDSFDYTKPIYGPKLRGFDYSFCNVYFGNKEQAHPSAMRNNHWLFENGMILDKSRPNFVEYDYHDQQPRITNKTIEYLEVFAGKKENSDFEIDRSKPFFIYYSSPASHDPIVPNKEFIGTSKAGKYGDFVVELDYRIGQILDKLKELELDENTMILLSSDNGPENHAYKRIQEFNHYSMGQLRGLKRDNYEGGNRVPFIVKWPAYIKPNTISNSPVCLTDLMATFSDMLEVELPQNQGEDSCSFLNLLNGSSKSHKRKPIVYHTHTGRMAIHDEDWVYIDASTGMQSKEPEWFRTEIGVVKHSEKVELFNLKSDPKQLNNVGLEFPDKIIELKEKLNLYVDTK